jgi:hypothetical protein
MRFLLISDTHRKLGVIDESAAQVQADAMIHAGHFGLCERGSYERVSEREGIEVMRYSDPGPSNQALRGMQPNEQEGGLLLNDIVSDAPYSVLPIRVIPVNPAALNPTADNMMQRSGDIDAGTARHDGISP